ncbi:putative ATPase involved in DNA repair/Chromosome segregation [Vibrio nigripulchritudo MADA3029]|uniref:type VI secretion system ImpA family N-terminal domain-containing protein n=1 Tax=Vibrio nigripulchritudo TaxID=28173 RepID=UPI0003B21C3B|nr:type VI secretion system ImpA family N-terminal domain-containing protein [Vibrio nigripulchritudo]CCN45804.1 putative ATPase involved in DNA repair/Chromosome segregation [Vibrio nigripulchritudo MADA3020]CCN53740.1 putative ATPase involved in DNA repair/Chromosome segregation [Vibrio nigripulchritudo MADA3021]CCN58664.1 putative ATPase involved in DNA repair/Chromosome segregation [Vibrio nigripulchritudo MADA3029]
MSNKIYIDHGIFTILSNQPSLRDSERYQKIRSEINGRMGFLSGATQWESVFNECIKLGTEVGMDFLLTSYFSVAGFKVEGVKGFASGLELMLAAYVEDKDHQALSSHHKQEIIQWMTSKVTSDLKLIKPNKDQIRDLYRCERALQDLNELCERFQPESSPNFEGIAFSIFEHIDRIETVTQVVQKPDLPTDNTSKSGRNIWMFFFILAWALTVAVAYFYSVERLKVCHAVEGMKRTVTAPTEELLSKLTEESVAELPPDEQIVIRSALVDAMDSDLKITVYQQYLNVVMLMEKAKELFPDNPEVEAAIKKIEVQSQGYREELQRDLERFYSARTLAANLVNETKHANNQESAERLEQYILSLSPIYSRNAYIQEQIDKQNYDLAKEELSVLQERVARIVWQLSSYQNALSDVAHDPVVAVKSSEEIVIEEPGAQPLPGAQP